MIISCKTNKNINNYNNDSVNLNSTQIIGELIYIYDINKEKDTISPCSKAPCFGRVKIIKVINKGKDYTNNLSENSIIEVKFAFTLRKTDKELFPNLKTTLPGINLNEKFKCDIESKNLYSDNPIYIVYLYTLLN